MREPFVNFNGRARDELLNIEDFANLVEADIVEADIVIEAWPIEYNADRPHSTLGGLAPAEFAKT